METGAASAPREQPPPRSEPTPEEASAARLVEMMEEDERRNKRNNRRALLEAEEFFRQEQLDVLARQQADEEERQRQLMDRRKTEEHASGMLEHHRSLAAQLELAEQQEKQPPPPEKPTPEQLERARQARPSTVNQHPSQLSAAERQPADGLMMEKMGARYIGPHSSTNIHWMRTPPLAPVPFAMQIGKWGRGPPSSQPLEKSPPHSSPSSEAAAETGAAAGGAMLPPPPRPRSPQPQRKERVIGGQILPRPSPAEIVEQRKEIARNKLMTATDRCGAAGVAWQQGLDLKDINQILEDGQARVTTTTQPSPLTTNSCPLLKRRGAVAHSIAS